ncbi:MAG: cyclic-di-AMP receptor [Erysipelotrichaceae bacterium]
MRMLLVVINEADQEAVLSQISKQGYFSTVLSTTGEFMRYGNATFIVGVEDYRINDIVDIIDGYAQSMIHQESGEKSKASIYILDIEKYLNDFVCDIK